MPVLHTLVYVSTAVDPFPETELDARHTGCIVLLDEPIADRSFPEWEMGLMRPVESELLALSSARWREMDAEHGAPGTGPSRGLTALRSFAYRKRGRF